jgi:hypothetical protein
MKSTMTVRANAPHRTASSINAEFSLIYINQTIQSGVCSIMFLIPGEPLPR